VVPVSVAPNPGRWYRRLVTYKAGYPSFRAHLAALAWRFIELHEERLADMAGGLLDVVTPVPSKRGRSYQDQPLQQALAVVGPIQERLAETLTFVPAPGIDWRRDYYPSCFDLTGQPAQDQRVLLVEDSWVTGATALAAAGALLGFGARSVVILPLGRVIDVSFWDGSEHPYVARLTGDGMERYDIRRWSR
jgi:predicted amidophosphoribosyltransferase